jgi:hypothetical protein
MVQGKANRKKTSTWTNELYNQQHHTPKAKSWISVCHSVEVHPKNPVMQAGDHMQVISFAWSAALPEAQKKQFPHSYRDLISILDIENFCNIERDSKLKNQSPLVEKGERLNCSGESGRCRKMHNIYWECGAVGNCPIGRR